MKRIWYYLLVVAVLGLLFFTSFKLLVAVSLVKCIFGGMLLLLTSCTTVALTIREILYYASKK